MRAPVEPAFAGTERFRLERRPGSGGTGVVVRARDEASGSSVAPKLLLGFDEPSVTRFKRELAAVRDVRHPNLVEVGELFFEKERWFFTMELVEGSEGWAGAWTRRSSRGADSLASSEAGRARPTRRRGRGG